MKTVVIVLYKIGIRTPYRIAYLTVQRNFAARERGQNLTSDEASWRFFLQCSFHSFDKIFGRQIGAWHEKFS